MIVEGAIKADEHDIKKENCLFIQFQENYKFQEVFICPTGAEEEEESAKLKLILNSSYPKMAGDSDVHLERPILADNAISYIILYDKDAKKVVYDGEVKFVKKALIDGRDPKNTNPPQLVVYNNIKDCRID